jgi:WD40 repeat protein
MPALFVSHASNDDAYANALEAWLIAHGFRDLFIDHRGIVAGDKWAEALRQSAGSCRVVICLVSQEWLRSDECFAEFRAAWYMGKRIVPLLLCRQAEGQAGERLAKVLAEDQGIDLLSCLTLDRRLDLSLDPSATERLESGLRAGGALAKVGLDPEVFPIEPKQRPDPFPGLASFGDDDADAGLFFGRSREIAETLEDLRKMRADENRRPYVILGASGAGKSSLLKAGIIPRLRRESPAWLPLRCFRPGADPLLNFAEAIARTLADYHRDEAMGTVRDRLLAAWRNARRGTHGMLLPDGRQTIMAALEAEGEALRTAAARPASSVLISIDQAEELIRAENESGEALSDFLRAALSPNLRWVVIFSVRTDSFHELQQHRRFQNLDARCYDLRALPTFRFDSVVERPAGRYGVEVESGLVDELMADAPKEDALPLLAFAMQRLWHQYAKSGRLTKTHYDNVGRLSGIVEDAAERALRGKAPELMQEPLDRDKIARGLDQLGAATFVPALAQINDQGQTLRRIANWSSFSEEAQELLTSFDRWRLVVRKGAERGGGTVEVAHEALFREWQRLGGWLEPEKTKLETLRSVESAAAVWNRHDRQGGWLDHRGRRLNAARALGQDSRYRHRLGDIERAYLSMCSVASTRRRQRGFALVAILALALAAIPPIFDDNASIEIFLREADRLNQRTEDSEGRLPFSEAAMRYALGAISAPTALLFPDGRRQRCATQQDIPAADCQLRRTGTVEPVVADLVDASTADSTAFAEALAGRSRMSASPQFNGDGSRLLTTRGNQVGNLFVDATDSANPNALDLANKPSVVELWDTRSGARLKTFAVSSRPRTEGPLSLQTSVPSQARSETIPDPVGQGDGGSLFLYFSGHSSTTPVRASLSPGGTWIAVADDHRLWIYSAESGGNRFHFAARDASHSSHSTFTSAVLSTFATDHRPVFSPDGKRLAVPLGSSMHLWSLNDDASGKEHKDLGEHVGGVVGLSFGPDSSRLVSVAGNGVARLWDAEVGALLWSSEAASAKNSYEVAFSPDGNRLGVVRRDAGRPHLDYEPGTYVLNVNPAGWSQDSADKTERKPPTLWLIDPIKGSLIREMPDAMASVSAPLEFSRDSKLFAVGSSNGAFRIFDARTGIAVKDLKDGSTAVSAVSFGRGSRNLAVARDAEVRIWDLEAGRPIATLLGHRRPVRSAAFSPDGTQILTTSADGTARVWDAETGSQLSLLRARSRNIRHASYSPRGDRVLTHAAGGSYRLWKLQELGELTARELRTWMCTDTKAARATLFNQEERKADRRLRGRPPDVCEWSGLDTIAGWRQLAHRWAYLLSDYDNYTASRPIQPKR